MAEVDRAIVEQWFGTVRILLNLMPCHNEHSIEFNDFTIFRCCGAPSGCGPHTRRQSILQYPLCETDQNQNNPLCDFGIPTFNPRLLHDGEHSTHTRKREVPL